MTNTNTHSRTLYTLADNIASLKDEARQGLRSWDAAHRLIEQDSRTSYLADGDRRKWCEGCGCGTRQERQWLYTCNDGELRPKYWSPDEGETAAPVWTCSNCNHNTKRIVQSDEARQRRHDKKLAERLAKLDREDAHAVADCAGLVAAAADLRAQESAAYADARAAADEVAEAATIAAIFGERAVEAEARADEEQFNTARARSLAEAAREDADAAARVLLAAEVAEAERDAARADADRLAAEVRAAGDAVTYDEALHLRLGAERDAARATADAAAAAQRDVIDAAIAADAEDRA